MFNIIIIIIIKKSAKSNRVQLWKTKFNNNGKQLMNHVVAAAAGLVLDQPSFFSTLLKKLILPPSVSIFKFLLSHDRPLHSPRCSWVSRILMSQNLQSKSKYVKSIITSTISVSNTNTVNVFVKENFIMSIILIIFWSFSDYLDFFYQDLRNYNIYVLLI